MLPSEIIKLPTDPLVRILPGVSESYLLWLPPQEEQASFNFMAEISICSDFEAQKNKVSHCFPIYLPWSDGTGCHDLSFLNVELQGNFFTLLFHFHQEAHYFFLTFCHQCCVICISEVIDISPSILDSSLGFIQSSILMMYTAYKLNKQGDNIHPWCTPFPIWNQSVVPWPVLIIASWPEYKFLRRYVRWSGISISLIIFHSLLLSTQLKALA